MNLEEKMSKVAICEGCQGFVLVCVTKYIDKRNEKEFTELTKFNHDAYSRFN